MKDPKVSIIVTTYNRSQLLKRAILSALDQNYGNFDLHIVDDASCDETRQVAESVLAGHEDRHYWRHEERKGLSAARNTGIARSSGDYIAFLDDDDEWKPECIEKRVELLMNLNPNQREKLGVVYCGCEVHTGYERGTTYNMPKIEGDIKENICARGLSTIPSSCLFPRVVLERIGGYDETLFSSVDHDIWMNLAAHGYYARYVNEPLVITYHLRKHKSMVTNTIPRIRGVEQYLTKWTPTYQNWFGKEGARKYIQRYRTRVLGGLLGQKLCNGELREAYCLFRHIVSQNRWSPIELVLLIRLIGCKILRMCVPRKVIDKVKSALSEDSIFIKKRR